MADEYEIVGDDGKVVARVPGLSKSIADDFKRPVRYATMSSDQLDCTTLTMETIAEIVSQPIHVMHTAITHLGMHGLAGEHEGGLVRAKAISMDRPFGVWWEVNPAEDVDEAWERFKPGTFGDWLVEVNASRRLVMPGTFAFLLDVMA